MRSIVVCELRCRAQQHAAVNAGLVSTACLAFPEHQVVFCARRDHLDSVVSKLAASEAPNLATREIEPPDRHAGWGKVFRGETRLVRRIRRDVSVDPFIFLLLATHASAVYATHLAFLAATGRRTLLQFVMHGNLNELVGWRSRRPWRRLQDLRSAVRYCGRARTRFLVLEHTIRDELERVSPDLSVRFDALPHPVDPGAKGDTPREALGRPIRVGYLGDARREKGFETFLDLATEIKSTLNGAVEFVVLGPLCYEVPAARLAALDAPVGVDPLPGEQYMEGIRGLDYVCLPHDKEHYRLSPSGVLLDAVSWQKPIIAMRLPSIERLFKDFGDIGFLCDGPADMRSAVADLVRRRDEALYRAQVCTLGRIRQARRPVSLAPIYRSLVEGWRAAADHR